MPTFDRYGARHVSFTDWWEGAVFIPGGALPFSRKDLVLSMAEQDGGAHIDPALNAKYAGISRHNSLGWLVGTCDSQGVALQGAEHAAVRQISHELLRMLSPTYEPVCVEDWQPTVFTSFELQFFDKDGIECKQQPSRMPEISLGKMRFYPEAGEFFFENSGGPTIASEAYLFELAVDSITLGSVTGVVGAVRGPAIDVPGIHHFEIIAGADQKLGVLGVTTDAVIDRCSVVVLPSRVRLSDHIAGPCDDDLAPESRTLV